ncbi:hypothetical protein QDA04_gp80 [Microbacterium phage Megan]|uniref:Uncharacterized protein n=1 Tax=Microbacterium phage Megan TaxID=2656551 RepID=A0A649VK31_9CAUD|nr:hypothetical protein QDA04_gp80 [Microbacterium phage Megan]QGJ92750.1 hypothetical protein PBI_MEGAN_80 [Microbacterium phage Megan]
MGRALDAPPVPEDVALLAERVGSDPLSWAFNCHGASLAIVQSGIYPGARVARGLCKGVPGQHSWVVADYGDEGVYDEQAHVIDPTLWCYDLTVTNVWQGSYMGVGWRHRPHGWGHFFTGDRPAHGGGETLTLTPREPLSALAREFLRMLGPLDARGWMMVGNLPVGGWPAAEVIAAMDDTPSITALVPIDRLGMLTDRNPSGLYMRTTA